MQRLQTRAQFQAVLAGSTVARTPHFALHRCPLDVPAIAAKPMFGVQVVWLGAMVPKRWAKRAVTRNAIKRQIYNVSAAPGVVLPMAAHIVRLRSGFDRKEFVSATSEKLMSAVRLELKQLLKQASGASARA